MKVRDVLKSVLTRKLLAICVLGILIPQALQLILRLTWAIVIILVLFLIFELSVVFVIKTWFPNSVNVSHVFEWTITTLIRVGSSLLSLLCHLLYSCFDLMFGKVFQTNTATNHQQQKNFGQRSRKESISASEQLKPNKDGYTPMARIAMTNSANQPNRRPRFSL